MRIPRTPTSSSGRPTAASRCTPPRTRRSSSRSPGPTSSCRPLPGRGSRSSPSRCTRRASPGANAPTTPPRSSDSDRLLDSADGNPLALVELPATLHQPGPTPDWMPVGELIVASFTARMSHLPAPTRRLLLAAAWVTTFHSADSSQPGLSTAHCGYGSCSSSSDRGDLPLRRQALRARAVCLTLRRERPPGRPDR